MTCPRCGHENAAAAKFCSECGAPLAALAAAPASEERKVVSVLFCDLVGFTAVSEQADPEDVRARLSPYHATLRHELERYGGTVEKFIGDAVMAVFGAPTVHEDDPERAVRAGLRILEAIEELGLDLQVRIGINTGPAVVSLGARPERGEGIVAGDVVNTAARIQAAAPVNGVAVSEETFRQTERVFAYEELPAVEAKGKSEPMRLYRALEARGRFGADLIRSQETLFVGREVEKALLQGLFDRCVRDSTVQIVTLVGEPGVGKSRLCAELFRYIDERDELIRWRQGRCLPYGEGITFWALGELVKSHVGVFESDSPEVATAKLRQMLPEVDERDWLEARLLPLLGIDSGEAATREESFSAWRRFVESIAADVPAVIVVEDLHWADAALLEFLSYFAEWADGVPLLLLCTARPELFEKHSTWGAGTRNAHTINLAPLSEGETRELVQGLLEQTVSEPVRQAILERAGGNPLYAEEFVRLVADRGLGENGDRIAFPDSVQALIAARLDTLSPERKSLLQDAAVVGKVFWSGALAAMAERDLREVELALHELSRKELVRPARRSSMEGEAEYAFWHVLVRDVAYGQIPRAVRARKHRAAAAWLEAKGGARVEDLADVLAHHYQQAYELAQASGDEQLAGGVLSAARRMHELAGDRAVSLDQAEAEQAYRRALALYPAGDPERAPLLLKAARLVLNLRQAEDDAREAIALYRSVGDELAEAEARLDLSRYLSYGGDDAAQLVEMEAARQLLEGHPPGPILAFYLARVAGNHMMAGRAAEGIATSNEVIELARRFGLTDRLATVLQYRGVGRTELGDLGGLDDLRQSIDLVKGAPALSGAIARVNLADSTWIAVGAREGLDLHLEAQAFSGSRGVLGSHWWSRAESAWMLYDLGRWDEILTLIGEIQENIAQLGGLQVIELALPYQAHVIARRGDARAAASICDELLPVARASDLQILGPTLAVAALAAGEDAAAREYVRELLDASRGASERHRSLFVPELARICVTNGWLDLAHELAGGLSLDIGRVGCTRTHAGAVLAEADGKLEEAAALFADAAARWEAFGGVPGQAAALLGRARCAGDSESLARARELYASMGDTVGLAEVAELG